MIDKNNLVEVLEQIGYQKENDKYKKFFSKVNCSIEVDLNEKKIIYPEEIAITAQVTTNFAKPENFVVLECVTRLLDKGYQPKDIELEKTWKLGHEPKGGSSDICVSGLDRKILFIIECKTAGVEYNKELTKMKTDGGQLFSYWNQERSSQWLILYSSDLIDSKVTYWTECVDCHDLPNSKKLYKDAKNIKELFEVWSTTYDKKFYSDVIFNDDTVAYQIGVKPLLKKYLKDFDEDNKIVNKFEEILRHNNISDKENAFNRLMALFICKLTDESQKSAEDELEFQYRSGTDNFESFQDRLQRLHRDGMNYFMDEDIFYVPINFVEDMVRSYTGQNRNNLVSVINDKLRKLKFYTNNDFSFKEVHNEKLFVQNAKILVEVVELFQKYKIIGAKNLQLLGDLFEQLLNKGFKQNEGQFFTPLPITRFIWESLPLAKLLESPEELPKIIDYACGAGHFLTQGFEVVNDLVSRKFGSELSSDWVIDKLFGIEKDYRLARVSKISMFMHGASNGNIIFGDGLENYPERNITKYSFDILVANPPYSVAAFKNHLNLSNAEDFEVLEKISIDGSEIETLFVERIAQLLKPKGIAAVILPSSILNKENSSFIVARVSILKNFYIRAIIQLGSKTFGATSTNTVILFLEKFSEPPKRTLEVEDSLDAIFELHNLANWEDELIYKSWLQKIDVNENTYKAFMSRQRNFDEWANDEYFGHYYNAFVNSREYINKIAQPSFIKFNDKEKLDWCNQKFYEFVISVEREKIKYFAYVYNQKTLIVTAPNDNKLQEKFLGYKWSNRKGQEGMQYVNEGGLLYDKNNREAENTIAALVRNIFNGQEIVIDELTDYYYYLNLQDMLNFKSINFTKVIKIPHSSYVPANYTGKYNLVKLAEVAHYVSERISIDDISIDEYITTDNMLKDKQGIKTYDGEPQVSSITRYDIDDILISNIRPYLKKIWLSDKSGGCSNDVLVFRSNDLEILLPKYLFVVLKQDMFFDYMMSTVKGMKMPRGDKEEILKYKFPLPSVEVQSVIVDDFNDIENKIKIEEDFLNTANDNVKNKFHEMFSDKNFRSLTVDKLYELQIGKTPSRNNQKYWQNGKFKWISIADMSNYERYTNDTNENISQLAIDETNIKIVPADTVIMSFKLTIGRTTITSEDIYTNEAIVAFIDKKIEFIDKDYLRLYLSSYNWSYGTMNAVKGMTLNKKSISSAVIKIPPKEEQEKFAEYVQLIESQKVEAIRRKENLIVKREVIIKKYFK